MLVSVITTCFNAEKCIEKTIRSVLSQTFRDFEYIIMDGASADDTLKIAQSYNGLFEKAGIPYHIYSQKDNGIYDGMNHGVARCSGEFVNFMNADDEFYDHRVLSDIFENRDYKDTGVIYGDAAEEEYGELYLFVKNFEGIKKRMPFSHQSVFARRELLMRYPFSEKYRIAADYDFLLNCYDEGVKFSDSQVMVCRVSKDGVSSLKLYDTFMDTEKMLASHGYPRYEGAALSRKLFGLRIRQFGMDVLPDFVKKTIRRLQRKSRGQDQRVQLL